jgi:V8-like Glu-specific endopeptidase
MDRAPTSFLGSLALPPGQMATADDVARAQELLSPMHIDVQLGAIGALGAANRDVAVDMTQFPFSAIVYLELNLAHAPFKSRGTGFFVDNHVIATAAHNLEDVVTIDVYVDLQGSLASATHYRAEDFRAHPSAPDPDFDFGVVLVAEDIGAAVGYFALDDRGAVGTTIRVGGYPERSVAERVTEGEILAQTSLTQLAYDAETDFGESGGAVYLPNLDPTLITAVGIHTSGSNAANPFNSGVRMRSDVKTWLQSF